MKHQLPFLIVLLAVFACTQTKPAAAPEKESGSIPWKTHRDVILEETDYGSIYITSDKTLSEYDWLIPEDIGSLKYGVADWYDSMVKEVLDSNNTVDIRHFAVKDLPRKWSSLYWYKGNYYVYSPTDWMSNRGHLISDSVLYRVYSDPYNAADLILDTKKMNGSTTRFKLLNTMDLYYLYLIIVDRKKGIAVWEHQDFDGNILYRELVVDSRKVKEFPMIMSDCGGQKCTLPEMKFDEPDYEALIKNAR